MKAEGTAQDLTRSIGEQDILNIGVSGPLDAALAAIRDIDGVGSATGGPEGIRLVVDDAGAVVARAIDAVTTAGASISSVEITQPDLEGVFLHLTGKALRD